MEEITTGSLITCLCGDCHGELVHLVIGEDPENDSFEESWVVLNGYGKVDQIRKSMAVLKGDK